MDQPITSFRKTKPYRKSSNITYHCSVHYALYDDDKDEFVRLIKDPEFQHEGHIYKANYIFRFDASKCATAVFNGETKGLIDLENEFVDGWTPLGQAAIMGAPRLTKYLIERGDIVDVTPDSKQTTTLIELAVEATASLFYQDERQSLFELFWRLSYHLREHLETVRLLVEKTQNKERVRQAFVDYVHKGQHVQFAILFLAAPELCSFASVYHELNSMEEAENGLSLLLDVFSTIGDKLVAYLRLEETTIPKIYQTEMEIDFFFREVARKKLGVISPDYYFRFHLRPGAVMQSSYDDDGGGDGGDDDDDDDEEEEEEELSCDDLEIEALRMFHYMHSFATRKNIDQAYIIRQLPTLKPEDADRLNKAIEKKLSSMPPLYQRLELNLDISGLGLHENEKLYDYLQTNTKISNNGEKYLPRGILFSRGRSFEPNVRSFHTCAARFDFKFTPTNNRESKVIKPTKLMSFLSAAKLSRFPMIAKRMIK